MQVPYWSLGFPNGRGLMNDLLRELVCACSSPILFGISPGERLWMYPQPSVHNWNSPLVSDLEKLPEGAAEKQFPVSRSSRSLQSKKCTGSVTSSKVEANATSSVGAIMANTSIRSRTVS